LYKIALHYISFQLILKEKSKMAVKPFSFFSYNRDFSLLTFFSFCLSLWGQLKFANSKEGKKKSFIVKFVSNKKVLKNNSTPSLRSPIRVYANSLCTKVLDRVKKKKFLHVKIHNFSFVFNLRVNELASEWVRSMILLCCCLVRCFMYVNAFMLILLFVKINTCRAIC
jgi:hypothetical protein